MRVASDTQPPDKQKSLWPPAFADGNQRLQDLLGAPGWAPVYQVRAIVPDTVRRVKSGGKGQVRAALCGRAPREGAAGGGTTATLQAEGLIAY